MTDNENNNKLRGPNRIFRTNKPEVYLAEDQYRDASALELLQKKVRTDRIEEVPKGRIMLPESDDQEDIKKSGQLLRYRQRIGAIVRPYLRPNDEVDYEIVLGVVARSTSARDNKIKALVLYGASDEEVCDVRINATRRGNKIDFARFIALMEDEVRFSIWSDHGLTPLQIFEIANGNDIREEAVALRSWAREKAKLIGETIESVLLFLTVASISSPMLIQQVQLITERKDTTSILSLDMLESISGKLPGRYPEQEKLVALALANGLSVEEIGRLASIVADSVLETTLDEIIADPMSYLRSDKRNEIHTVRTPEAYPQENLKYFTFPEMDYLARQVQQWLLYLGGYANWEAFPWALYTHFGRSTSMFYFQEKEEIALKVEALLIGSVSESSLGEADRQIFKVIQRNGKMTAILFKFLLDEVQVPRKSKRPSQE